MKKILIFSVFLPISIVIYAQRGKESDNNSKSPQEEVYTEVANDEISINPQIFTKSSNADSYVEIEDINIGVWYDASKWTVNETAYSIRFKHKNPYFLEVNLHYSNLIKSDVEHSKDQIKIWQNIYDDFNLRTQEFRNVNETNVVFLYIEGEMASVKQIVVGYHKATAEKTIILRAVIASNKFSEFESDIMELLNGLVIK